MYTKDLNNRITLRLDDDLMRFVIEKAKLNNVTPSEFIRSYLRAYMMLMEVRSHVDDKSLIDNKL